MGRRNIHLNRKMSEIAIILFFSIISLFSSIYCPCEANSTLNNEQDNLYKHVLTLQSPEPSSLGLFGYSTVLTDESIIVGEPGTYNPYKDPFLGKVWIFGYDGELIKSIKSPSLQNDSNFGNALAVCGDVLFIGESMIDVDSLVDSGSVHLYDLNGNYLKSLHSPEASEKGEFGRAISANENLVAVGEPGPWCADDNFTCRVHLYNADGVLLRTIHAPETVRGNFGFSLDVSENHIIVGEPYCARGRAYIYDINGSLRSILTPEDSTRRAGSPTRFLGNFGYSVSVDGDTIVVGQIRDNVGSYEMAGRVYVYDVEGNLLFNLTSPQPRTYGYYGYSKVRGDVIAVSDHKAKVVWGSEGLTHLYNIEGELITSIQSPEPVIEGDFGTQKDIQGDLIAISELGAKTEGLRYAGKLHLFRFDKDAWCSAASFYLDELSITPPVSYTNDTVTISVVCHNNGTLPGSHNVTMSIDRKHSLVKTVTLGPGENSTVSFELRGTTGGIRERTFWVYFDGLKGSYTVKQTFWERIHVNAFELLVTLGLIIGALILWIASRKKTAI